MRERTIVGDVFFILLTVAFFAAAIAYVAACRRIVDRATGTADDADHPGGDR
jgi:hypothetical protein